MYAEAGISSSPSSGASLTARCAPIRPLGAVPPAQTNPAAVVTTLLTRRLLVFTGKGGTGKSTVAAAFARLATNRGLRVLACEANSHDRLPSLLRMNAPRSMDESARIRHASANLSLVNLRPETALFEYGVMKLRSRRVTRGLLGNRVVHYFLRVIPSISEVLILGKLLHHVRENADGRSRFDLVILDAPATGHGISLLRLPQVLLASVPAGPLRDDMTWMNALLVDPAVTAVNLVTRPEELPVNETLELNAKLRDEVKVPRGACFLDNTWPSRFDAAELQELESLDAGLGAVASQMQGLADQAAEQEQRLRRELDVPVVALPQLFVEDLQEQSEEHVLVDRLAELLAP
jgi:anion-transporting  ArsA/GET3 family ATPase